MTGGRRPDGLRRLVTLTAETDDDLEALVERLRGSTLEGRMELAELLARRVLADAGLPTEWGHYLAYRDGRIEPAPPEAASGAAFHPDAADPEHWKCRTLAGLAEGPAPSLKHDAAMVLGFAAAVRDGIAGGCDPVELARRAMRLGETFEALRLSVANGWRLAETGRKVCSAAKKGGAESDALADQALLSHFNEMMAESRNKERAYRKLAASELPPGATDAELKRRAGRIGRKIRRLLKKVRT